MQGYLVNLLYVSLFSFSFLFIITPQRLFRVEVVKVIDGDTVRLSSGESIRFAHIDAPELSQDSIDGTSIGELSKSILEKLLYQKTVKIKLLGRDYFDRYLGILYVNGVNINEELVNKGYAVSYERKYLYAEYMAKKKRIGIWATKGFYYPKVHRKYKKKYKLKITKQNLVQN